MSETNEKDHDSFIYPKISIYGGMVMEWMITDRLLYTSRGPGGEKIRCKEI